MKFLITGGAGCLGSNLIEHFLPQGHDILVVDNFATCKRELLPEIAGLSLIEGSVADSALVDKAMADFKPDVVIHSAASYKDPDDWREDVASNILGSVNVAKASKANGVGRLINFQTNLCYGRPDTLPVPVDHSLRPFTSYGISKTAGEQFMLLSGVPTVSLRLGNVTGPRLAIGPIPTFYKRLKAGQSCFCSDTARDFLDMSDFLSFMDLAIKPDAPSGVFNVSSGKAHTIKDIYLLVASHFGIDGNDVKVAPPGEDDVPVMTLDPVETQRAFGWKAQVDFADIIKRQLAWYDRHGVSDIYSHLKAPDLMAKHG